MFGGSVEMAVTKMIGIERVRSRALISRAVSKPSSPGIWTSSRIAAKSSCSSALSASSPELAVATSQSSGDEHGLHRDEVVGAVVDQQDLRPQTRCSHTRISAISWSMSTGLVM